MRVGYSLSLRIVTLAQRNVHCQTTIEMLGILMFRNVRFSRWVGREELSPQGWFAGGRYGVFDPRTSVPTEGSDAVGVRLEPSSVSVTAGDRVSRETRTTSGNRAAAIHIGPNERSRPAKHPAWSAVRRRGRPTSLLGSALSRCSAPEGVPERRCRTPPAPFSASTIAIKTPVCARPCDP
jgi:hypothetical protein